jgi:hypothetical protein
MPKFRTLNPEDVHVGRGKDAAAARVQFVKAIESGDAGRIDLEAGDNPTVIKRRLREASKQAGIKVRSSWADDSQKTLFWKRTGL